MMNKKILSCGNLSLLTCVLRSCNNQKLTSNSNPERSKVSGPVGVYVSGDNSNPSFNLSKLLK